jgi:3,4-dihydroxy-2-butanone 4-phosphate synthase
MSIQLGRKPSVIDDFHAGKIIILVDDIDRENEGNLV